MYYFHIMPKKQNLRIEVSEEARRALNFEVALTGESLAVCASKAIIAGVSKKAVELANVTSQKPVKVTKTVTSTVKPDESVQSTPTTVRKGPLKKDPEAMKYIDDHIDTMSGVDIASAIGRSVASVNKYIKSKRDALV